MKVIRILSSHNNYQGGSIGISKTHWKVEWTNKLLLMPLLRRQTHLTSRQKTTLSKWQKMWFNRRRSSSSSDTKMKAITIRWLGLKPHLKTISSKLVKANERKSPLWSRSLRLNRLETMNLLRIITNIGLLAAPKSNNTKINTTIWLGRPLSRSSFSKSRCSYPWLLSLRSI